MTRCSVTKKWRKEPEEVLPEFLARLEELEAMAKKPVDVPRGASWGVHAGDQSKDLKRQYLEDWLTQAENDF